MLFARGRRSRKKRPAPKFLGSLYAGAGGRLIDPGVPLLPALDGGSFAPGRRGLCKVFHTRSISEASVYEQLSPLDSLLPLPALIYQLDGASRADSGAGPAPHTAIRGSSEIVVYEATCLGLPDVGLQLQLATYRLTQPATYAKVATQAAAGLAEGHQVCQTEFNVQKVPLTIFHVTGRHIRSAKIDTANRGLRPGVQLDFDAEVQAASNPGRVLFKEPSMDAAARLPALMASATVQVRRRHRLRQRARSQPFAWYPVPRRSVRAQSPPCCRFPHRPNRSPVQWPELRDRLLYLNWYPDRIVG